MLNSPTCLFEAKFDLWRLRSLGGVWVPAEDFSKYTAYASARSLGGKPATFRLFFWSLSNRKEFYHFLLVCILSVCLFSSACLPSFILHVIKHSLHVEAWVYNMLHRYNSHYLCSHWVFKRACGGKYLLIDLRCTIKCDYWNVYAPSAYIFLRKSFRFLSKRYFFSWKHPSKSF